MMKIHVSQGEVSIVCPEREGVWAQSGNKTWPNRAVETGGPHPIPQDSTFLTARYL